MKMGTAMAYRYFAYVALLNIGIALLAILPLENATIQVIGMMSIPFVLLWFAAGVGGVLITLVRHRREWPLVSMSAAFVGFMLLFTLSESLSADQYRQYKTLIDAGVILSLLVIVLLSGHWLFFTRRQKKEPGKKP